MVKKVTDQALYSIFGVCQPCLTALPNMLHSHVERLITLNIVPGRSRPCMHETLARLSHSRRWQPLAWALACIMVPIAVVLPGAGLPFANWLADGIFTHMVTAPGLLWMFFIPGLALLRLLWPTPLPLSVRLALAPGLSVCLPPILLLAAHVLGLPWNGLATWGYLLISLLICLAPYPFTPRRWPWQAVQVDAPLAMLCVISLAALLVRLYAVRDLPTGLWNDSYHHTLMAALLVEQHGIFSSWEPYAPLTTFTYHYGFHANAAFVSLVTGIPVIQAVVITGQILNALTVPLMFACAVLVLRTTPHTALWAALIVGFVVTLPAYFVNWGRYTQLTGQVVLVAVLVAWAALVDARPANLPGAAIRDRLRVGFGVAWRPVLLAALATTALMLTHYLITVVGAAMVACLLLWHVLEQRSWKEIGRIVLIALPMVVLAVLLATPWFWNVLGGDLTRNASAYFNQTTAPQIAAQVALPPLTPLFFKWYTLLGMLVGLMIAAWQRAWRMLLPASWLITQFVLIGPHLFGLPGAGTIDFLTSLGSIYLVLGPLLGLMITTTLEAVLAWLRASVPAWLPAGGTAMLMLALIAWGSGWQARIVDTPQFQQVSPADMAAMAWIRTSTPPDARFLVNGYPYYGGVMVIANDAGGWIPLLAGRTTTLPAMTYGSERGTPDDLFFRISRLWETLRNRPMTDPRPVAVDLTRPEALAALRAAGVTHVYSGARPNPVAAAADRVDTAKLRASPDFRLVYDQDGVEMFQIVGQP